MINVGQGSVGSILIDDIAIIINYLSCSHGAEGWERELLPWGGYVYIVHCKAFATPQGNNIALIIHAPFSTNVCMYVEYHLQPMK
jgi:hypothetical protein